MSTKTATKPLDPPIVLRSYNERVIYDLVRTSGSPSRADVKRRSSLTFPSVSRIVNEFIKLGLVTEAWRRRGGMGKPPTELAVNPTRVLSVGVAYADHRFSAVLIDMAANVLARWREAFSMPDAQTLPGVVAEAVKHLMARDEASERPLAGVGVGLPASVVEGFRANNLGRPLGLPVLLETTATAGAVAERWLIPGSRHMRSSPTAGLAHERVHLRPRHALGIRRAVGTSCET